MNLFRDLERFPSWLDNSAVTIGNFDGVHRGHVKILRTLKEHAERLNGPSVVLTFEPHPAKLLRPETMPPSLTWADRKAKLLLSFGIDAVVIYPTDPWLLALTPSQFFEKILQNKLKARAIIEGPNFYFGKDRTGSVETLKDLCHQHHVELEIVQPIRMEDEIVSSSRIRHCLASGRVADANKMLNRPHRIRGQVTSGAGRGTQIGIPTANLESVDAMVPADGVYAGFGWLGDRRLGAAINIGPNPTFGEQAKKMEVHLLDFSSSIYGQMLEIDFISRVRDIREFSGPNELVKQLQLDLCAIREIIAKPDHAHD